MRKNVIEEPSKEPEGEAVYVHGASTLKLL